MEIYKPRQTTPEPQPQNIKLPTYTVPDVTLMFDSDDSLIWKPGDNRPTVVNNQKFNVLHNLGSSTNILRPGNIELDENDKENFPSPVYKELKRPIKTSIEKISSPLSENFNFNHASSYNPHLYTSPNQGKISLQREGSSRLKNNDLEIYPQSQIISTPKLQPKNSCSIKDAINVHCNNTNSKSYDKFGILFKSSDQGNLVSHLDSEGVGDVSINKDAYILKLIEGQNQQIFYLHKVLEKLLDNSNNGLNCTNKETLCRQCLQMNNKISKDNAATQTSCIDLKPETRDIATNTEISWNNLILSIEEKNRNEKTNSKKEIMVSNNLQSIKNNVQNINTNDQSKRKEESLTLKDIVVETVFDPLSPEPSLHINVPEFHDDQILRNENIWIDDEKKDDSPLVGESALAFNERLKINNGHTGDEMSQEEKNGVTFYNKVMINVQQVLHKYGNNDSDHQIQFKEHREESMKNMPSHSTNVLQGLYNPTNLQLQQFGISFLDPVTLADKRKVLPAQDTFYMPSCHLKERDIQDLEVHDGCKRERLISPHYVSDAHLVSIAQKYQGTNIFNKGALLGTQRHYQVIAEESPDTEEFSFATKKFLGKYKLDN